MNKIKQGILTTGIVIVGALSASAQGSKHEKKEAMRIEFAERIQEAIMDDQNVIDASEKYLAKEKQADNSENLPLEKRIKLGQEERDLYKELNEIKEKTEKNVRKQLKKEEITIEYSDEDNNSRMNPMDHPDVKKAYQEYLAKEKEADNSENLPLEERIKLGQEERELYKEFDKAKIKVKKESEN